MTMQTITMAQMPMMPPIMGTPTMTTPMALRMELRITGTPRMIPPTAQAMQTKMVQAIMAQPTTEATELWMIWAMT
jgi:hypothetical protein